MPSSAAQSPEALLTDAHMLDPGQCSRVLHGLAIAPLCKYCHAALPQPVSVRHLALKQGLWELGGTKVIEARTAIALLCEKVYELQVA